MHSPESELHHGSTAWFHADYGSVSDRLSDFLSTITRSLKGQAASHTLTSKIKAHDCASANLPSSAREFADYVSRYLSMAFHGSYGATCYEPKLGRLHPARPRQEPLLHMAWRPLNERPMQASFDLNIGADDLCFSGFLAPKTQRDRLALKATLALKKEAIQERMWEHSLRFLPDAEAHVWEAWNESRATWLPSGLSRSPKRFGVLIESCRIVTPVPPGRVAYHVSENVRRFKAVLDLL